MSGADVARLLGEAARWRRRGPGRVLIEASTPLAGDLHWVGGVVRDALRGFEGPDVDLLWSGDLAELATALRAHGVREIRERPSFRTMTARIEGHDLDIAAPRRDEYPTPGGAPRIEPVARVEDDLARRDFTAHAMLVTLPPEGEPRLIDPHDGLADLRARQLRPVGPRTLIEDPMRILRGARYLARCDWRPAGDWDAPLTAAREPALWRGVATGRMWQEWQRIGDERTAAEVVQRLQEWRLLPAILGGEPPESWIAWMAAWRAQLGMPERRGGGWLIDLAGLRRTVPTIAQALPERWPLLDDHWPRLLRFEGRLARPGGDPMVLHGKRALSLLPRQHVGMGG